MSLTVLYRGQNIRFSMKLSKPRWLSIIILFVIVSGFFTHLFLRPDPIPEHLESQLPITVKDTSAKQLNEQRILALTVKLADLQSHVLRLNALSDRLAEQAKIPKKEFNMATLPASGGPFIAPVQTAILTSQMLTEQVDKLGSDIDQKEKQLRMLESLALGHHIQKESYLSGRPIGKGWLSSYYGIRNDPFTGKKAMHKGVDFAGKEDGPVIATGSGVVSWASERYGYGNLIEIDHGAGYKTRYGHNKALLVKVGDVVTKGQQIAKMGSTGRSTGPHVHYEILRSGKQINPIKYVYRKSKG